jgi:limonene-1,2-epoxide hydrolase
MSENKELAKRCALNWFELTPETARELFTEDAIFESVSDNGVRVKGPEEIYELLDVYRNMCDRFETRLLNAADDGDVVLLERDEITFLKNGKSVRVPVMSSIRIRDGKIALWRDYWDLAILMNHLLVGPNGDQATESYVQYMSDAQGRGAPVEPINY